MYFLAKFSYYSYQPELGGCDRSVRGHMIWPELFYLFLRSRSTLKIGMEPELA